MENTPIPRKNKIIILCAFAITVASSIGIAWLAARLFPALPFWCVVIIGVIALPITFELVCAISRTANRKRRFDGTSNSPTKADFARWELAKRLAKEDRNITSKDIAELNSKGVLGEIMADRKNPKTNRGSKSK